MSDERTPLLQQQIQQQIHHEQIQQNLQTTVSGLKSNRIVGMDLFKGLLMVLMAIDHARGPLSDIQYPHEEWYGMPDYHGNTYHWAVRFATCFCAPGFFMLMGWGVALFVHSRTSLGWSWARILRHFAIRGAVLCALNFILTIPYIIMIYSKQKDAPLFLVITAVIFALGINIFIGAIILYCDLSLSEMLTTQLQLSHPPTPVSTNTAAASEAIETVASSVSRSTPVDAIIIATYTVFITILACLPSYYTPTADHGTDRFSAFWVLFFLPSVKSVPWLYSIYPPFPWLAPTVLGLLIGRCTTRLKLNHSRQAMLCAVLGVAMISIFIPIRLFGGFGNINPSLVSPPATESLINFFNMVKYPPSLVYLLWNLGACLIVLAPLLLVSSSAVSVDNGPLMVFGNSALFFFMTHSVLYQLAGAVLLGLCGLPVFSGAAFWAVYAAGLVLEYVACRSYAKFKRRTPVESIWRFF